MDKLVEQLKELRAIKPRAEWVASNRSLLLAQIKSQATVQEAKPADYLKFAKMLMPTRFVQSIVKPMYIAGLAFLFVVGSGALTVSAARESLPGNVLYPVKLTSERVAVSLAGSPAAKAKASANNAAERVREIEKIISTNTDAATKNQMISVASDNLKKNMDSVVSNLDQAKSEKGDSAETLAAAQNVGKTVTDLTQRLEQNNQAGGNEQTAQIIADAKNTVNEAGVKAVEVIVDKYDKGETTITSEEMVKTMEGQLKKIEDRIATIKTKEETVPVIVKPVNPDVVAPVVKPGDAPVVTPEVSEIVETVKNATEVKAVLDEAMKLMNEGNLLGALEKMKESNTLSEQAEAAIDARIEQLKNEIK